MARVGGGIANRGLKCFVKPHMNQKKKEKRGLILNEKTEEGEGGLWTREEGGENGLSDSDWS